MLNKLTVSELAELSKLSKAYVSQVKHGKRPPSRKLLDALSGLGNPKSDVKDYLNLFLQSRQANGVSSQTLRYYRDRLDNFVSKVHYLKASRQEVENYLSSIPPNQYGLGTRHASYRAIRAFYNWLSSEYNFLNPITNIPAPILSKPILPSLGRNQVTHLIGQCENTRDKSIIALFTESGLRLSELSNIKASDIDWQNRIIRVLGKGRKEAYAPFGELSEQYLKEWLVQYEPNGNIWGLNEWGIVSMLRRLEKATGLPCNPHTFRRTFACLLRKAGVDTMTIKDLGRWESLEMVQRYTRSVSFQDSLKFYKAPLS
ncbi:tyrosine-type recombinase/integrase [Chloroflexota bacterium]